MKRTISDVGAITNNAAFERGALCDLTPLGQSILDAICDHVVTARERGCTGGHGHISWTIGRAKDVVAFLAAKLGRSPHSIAGALRPLVQQGLVQNKHHRDSDWSPHPGLLSLNHSAWQHYSGYDPAAIERDQDRELEYWLEWDGVDGTDWPYDNMPAFEE